MRIYFSRIFYRNGCTHTILNITEIIKVYLILYTINWNKIEGTITAAVANAATSTINDNSNGTALAMMSNFGIPLSSSMSVGFTIGFMKG
jgi:hypothetical protein